MKVFIIRATEDIKETTNLRGFEGGGVRAVV
jgi:hypothetical protein